MRVLQMLLLIAVTESALAERPNILLLISDDQRPDTIHALGNDIIETPNLDRLVRSGSAFLRATCANPICTPSRAEILTGCTGFRCGVIDFGRTIDPDLPTMSKWFSAAGYVCSYVGKWHNDGKPVQRGYHFTKGLYRGGGGKYWKPKFDFAGRPVTGYRGWIFQDDDGNVFPEKGVGLTSEISSHFADAAIEVIQNSSAKPFFLHVNFTSPHDPLILPQEWKTRYEPADMKLPENFMERHPFDHGNFDGRDEVLFQWPRTPEETRREIAAYYAVISHMDQQIGRILNTLKESGKAENTIIVFSSDHGLGVGSHGLRGKQSMYEHTIGIPMLIQGPNVPANRRFDAQCYLRDLFPTLCDLAEVEGPGKQIDGRSLKPVMDGTTEQIHEFIVGYFRKFQRMIRTPEWKYVEYPEVNQQQLFHLPSDPNELENLADDETHAKQLGNLQKTMRQWFRERNDSVYAKP